MISAVDCVKAKELGLGEYVQRSDEWILKVVAGTMEVGEKKADYVRRFDDAREERLREKALH